MACTPGPTAGWSSQLKSGEQSGSEGSLDKTRRHAQRFLEDALLERAFSGLGRAFGGPAVEARPGLGKR